jgi:hypothetical protein
MFLKQGEINLTKLVPKGEIVCLKHIYTKEKSFIKLMALTKRS